MCSVSAELPTVSLEFQVLGDVGPIECGLPLRNVKVLVDPGLVVVRVCSNVNGGKLGDGIGGVPIAKGQFGGNGCILG